MRGTSGKGMPTLLLCRNHESTGVVSLASLDGDAFACGTDFYLMITGVAVVAVRRVGKSVLVASFLGYSRIKPFHGCALGGVIDIAAGVGRVIDQAGELSF